MYVVAGLLNEGQNCYELSLKGDRKAREREKKEGEGRERKREGRSKRICST